VASRDPLRRAVFLDRDGVLIDDRGLIIRNEQICLLPGVPEALKTLKAAGLFLAVVSNQAVVARGLIDEKALAGLNERVGEQIEQAGGPPLDAVYYCPHHPEATLPEYRLACQCRKPRPGMILAAAAAHGLDLVASFLVGDRMTDIAAGAAAGCRTVLVTCGRHDAPPIVSVDPPDRSCRPDHTCPDLRAAAQWILGQL
jgi:D-glycero-D-manno-heptose 1,7-bisphosphate phosphatase